MSSDAPPRATDDANAIANEPSVRALDAVQVRRAGPPRTDEAPGPAGTFGTPISASTRQRVSIEVEPDARGSSRVRCVYEGDRARPAPCPQCASRPDSAALVRAFYRVERAINACSPPADRRGRIPVRGRFVQAGFAEQYEFPGVRVDDETAACLGAALCTVRVPTFREPTADLEYDYVVLQPLES